MPDQGLPFEKPLIELESQLRRAVTEEERASLANKLEDARREVFSNLTPWQRVMLARHPSRPRTLDLCRLLFDEFIELHGDRLAEDDPAMIGALAKFRGQTVMVVGQEKGVSTDERVQRNFGMAHPTGYRKALRLFRMAERFQIPVLTFVDTPAAHPGIDAEAGGQGSAIAYNLLALAGLRTPVFSVVIAEGGSGGALGIAVADHVAMFEHAIYVICPPERCAEILWRDVEKKELAASAMRITAEELKSLEVIDSILQEPPGGAHRDHEAAAGVLGEAIGRFLDGCKSGKWTLERRHAKFQQMGMWREFVQA